MRLGQILALLIGLVVFTSTARADAPVACNVLEIEASSGDAPSMDADLKVLEKNKSRRSRRGTPSSAWAFMPCRSR
jgi:hypothetical protein